MKTMKTRTTQATAKKSRELCARLDTLVLKAESLKPGSPQRTNLLLRADRVLDELRRIDH